MSVKGLLVSTAAILALALAAGAEAPRPLPAGSGGTALDRLLVQGWKMVAPDVLERREADGTVRTIAFGLSALEVEARQLRGQLRALRQLQELHPSPDLAAQIAARAAVLAEVEAELAAQPEEGGSPASGDRRRAVGALIQCDLDLSYGCGAGPSKVGPSASANASFTDTCNHDGDAWATAYAEGSLGTSFRFAGEDDGPTPGTGSASASAFASVFADNDCFSDAYARLRVEDDLGQLATYTCYDDNTECRPVPPFSVTITGCDWSPPDSFGSCSATCTGSITGGTAPYTPNWTAGGAAMLMTIDGLTAGGSCGSGELVLFEASDSAGGYDSDTEPCCGG